MTTLTLRRRDVLAAGVGAFLGSFLTKPARADSVDVWATRADHVIVLWMNGGPSHLDTWDPKAGKVAGPHKAIATKTPGLSISEHLPALASMSDKLAVVRSLTSKEGNHQRAQYQGRTGYSPNPTVIHPAFSAWMSKRLGEPKSGLPAVVSLGGPSVGPGFFGAQHGPFVVQAAGQMPQNVRYGTQVDDARFSARMGLLAGMEERFSGLTGDAKVDARRAIHGKAERLMHASALDAFDVEKEPAAVRAAFGDTAFGKGCLSAARLVASGVRYVEVTLDGWDTHQDNFGRTKKLMGVLDPAMSSLLRELETRGLFDQTLVVWMGDFGRTPRINGNEGRDHHPAASSVVLAGAGVRKGIVHGETDAEGAKVVKDPVRVADLVATMAKLTGLDPADSATSPAGRPIALANDGSPVAALMG
jgi:uncharacterized protein (DUF1501 family)